MSVSVPTVGGGTTAVLGTKFVVGLANTGIGLGVAIWSAVAGAASLAAGAVTLGRGRRVSTGESLGE